ncbi:hypothetical protein MM0352_15320 [Helicobacter pylori]
MLKVCLNFLEFERNFRVGKEWIKVIGNEGNGGWDKALIRIKHIIK